MPSEAEKFLGIDDEARPHPPPAKGLLGKRWIWLVLPVIAYLPSILWLNVAFLCVPYVVAYAPCGLTALFDQPTGPVDQRIHVGPWELVIHVVFWGLYLTGLIGCKNLSRRTLLGLFWAVSVILVLTLEGCATYYQFPPLKM